MAGGFPESAGFANLASFGSAGNQQIGTTVVAASATINTKGSWVSLGTVTVDCSHILLRLSYLNNNGTDTGVSFDIGIGGSGSQTILISNINLAQPSGTAVAALDTFQHVIPLQLPAGTQVWARSACNVASNTATLGASFVSICDGFGANGTFGGVETLGWTAVGAGTALTGGANAKGSYVSLGTTTRDYVGFFLCFDYAGATAGMKALVDIAIGGSGSQVVIAPNITMALELGFSAMDCEFLPIQIKGGTQVWARSCNFDGSTSTIGVTLYGVY